ncbi:TOMM precursor leader peptide-binding protein [Corynebacterium halotolerans]|uniref:Bacteriocin biosynthesis cyclodehydratase domain-containing protein n=1 Tax=Corynebacterium halotolerans YIM 70093 = DSM 44683 TaxID=1121362 RepID=M1NQJ2_9CORY|nr:TOMM precursor leader peptide-binding protein [Corynebacterium halotolerans]AGF71787.1 hypothetical protein A605_03880 [Corynebacterium halotolerans YIM 70093 = DSM 44683]
MGHLQLAPGAHVFLRGPGAVQFGLDATRAGVIETDSATGIVAGLLVARRPTSRARLEEGLILAGLSAPAARSLLDDLVVYRILRPVPRASVILLGRGRLAELTAELLRRSRVTVRSPLRGESELAYLAGSDIDVPVLVVDRIAHARTMAPLLTRFARTWLPGAVVDARGLVGPLHLDGAGPCPLCVELHRTDTDGHWHRVVTQLPGGPVNPDPVVVAATAAQLTAAALALVGVPEPPGTPRRVPAAGEVTEVDPYTLDRRHRLATHPRCPVCFTLRPPGRREVYRKLESASSSPAP